MTVFKTNSDAVNGWQHQVGDVGTDVSDFINGAPGVSGVQNSHGAIGNPMQTAFAGADSARGGAVGATQTASATIADLLGQAAKAYERGDVAAGGKLKAQADQMEDAGSGGATAAGAGGGGADAMGQMMGQFGQMASQMAQSLTQPLQGLSQIPQQVMQGVQGLVQTATEGAAGGAEAGAGAAEAGAGAAESATKDNAAGASGEGSGTGPAPVGDERANEKGEAELLADPEKQGEPQLGERAPAGIPAEPGMVNPAGTVPTQVHNINPQR